MPNEGSAPKSDASTPATPITHKALAYVTRGDRLLIFRHVHEPEAGLQVPGGTVEPHETPAQAVMREVLEETGLTGLSEPRHLGTLDHPRREEPGVRRRHFFHLHYRGDSPDRWQHYERHPSEGGAPILYELYWVRFPDQVPELIPGHDACFAQLGAALRGV